LVAFGTPILLKQKFNECVTDAAGDDAGGDILGVRGGVHDEGDGEGGGGGGVQLVIKLKSCKKKIATLKKSFNKNKIVQLVIM